MLNSILRLFNRMFDDILAGRNIESYAFTLVAIALAILGLVWGALPSEWQQAALLTGIAILVFKTTVPIAELTTSSAIAGALKDLYKNKAGTITAFDVISKLGKQKLLTIEDYDHLMKLVSEHDAALKGRQHVPGS